MKKEVIKEIAKESPPTERHMSLDWKSGAYSTNF